MISTVEEKAIDNIIEVIEPLLSQNEKDKPMYGTITEECDYVKKLMGDVLSILTGNGICDLLCEQYQ